ncbi:hypothetical protein [Acrocarpospora catenulata]|uniref:hypothetical protein n=1 Tax=Acrocarpospora catenulata TaxID=2836182 RepID=UPI001BDA89CC|nr:hypothetical protein [Acrocarpospora catenulata]
MTRPVGPTGLAYAPASDVIISIVGAGRPAGVEAAVRGARLVLTEAELRSLDDQGW